VAGTPLTHLWTAGGPKAVSQPVAVVDSALYVAGSGRQIIKLDLRGGAVIWSQRVGGPIAGGLLYSNDRVYAATDQPEGKVRAWTALAGNDVWSTSVGPVNAPLARVGNLIVARNRAGFVFGLDVVTGAEKWRVRTSLGPAPAIAGDSGEVIVPSLDSIFRLDLATGRVRQRLPSPGPLVFPLIRTDSSVRGVTADGQFFELRSHDLQVTWRVATHAVPAGMPLVRGDSLEFVSTLGRFYRARAGESQAAMVVGDSMAAVLSGPTVYGGLLLVGGANGMVSARDSAGAERWRVQIRQPAETAPIVVPGGLVLIGGDGDIHRFRQ
jgi:outer membrane protein assembly factor BamB